MTIALKPAANGKPSIEMFNRAEGGWSELTGESGSVSFDLGPGLGELLRITGVASR